MHELLADVSSLIQQPVGFRPGATLICLVMAGLGTLILNGVTGTSDAARMVGNFGVLIVGALIATAVAGLFHIHGDPLVVATFATAAGMTVTSIATMAVLRPV